ncbi:FecR domain-containing protein [Usitatibacter palustris]|uniref:SPOR domain-containing protein n=1 Tax=Usitatibacter palustris TaxID=2732487 RepID=A0A6M4H218_9PROT|nr:FecR domain-containing protein [Usitatibacter palustris]QJR13382.1 hypothetical protein DSM104440_00165 [Usitatibacter palustris]
MKKTIALLLAAFAFSAAANAQVVGTAEAVQFPAFLERGGNSVPLSPGTSLQAKDTVRTGAGARVLIKLTEGSLVKLGENAHFTVEKAQPVGVFKATLGVLQGAFRFTSDALRKGLKRDVEIKVKNVTAGIRGTDLWGRSTTDEDLVCLLEGNITVGTQGHPTVTLDTPLDFYRKRSDAGPVVAKVDPEKVKEWAAETEMVKDGPIGRVGGSWRVVAAAVGSRDEALALNRRVRASGYPSEVAQTPSDKVYVVQVAGLAGEPEARAVMANLRTVAGVISPSVRQGP